MTPLVALAWLRAHPRTAEALACVLCVALGWVWHRPSAPSITAKQTESVHKQAAERHETQVAAQQQTVAAASASENINKNKLVHVHRVERISKDGSRVITTDRRIDDSVHIEEAQQINVVLNFASLAQSAGQSSSSTTTTRETTLVQAPAPAPRFRLGALAGLSTKGPEYGGEASLRVLGPLWLSGGVLVGPAPVGFVGLGVEF